MTYEADSKAREKAATQAPDASKEKLREHCMALHQQLKNTRTGWDSHWQALASYVQPRKAFITEARDGATPDTAKEDRLFDSTAVQANLTLASGHMAWMTPAEALWFAFGPPEQFADDDEVKGWLHRCSQIAALELARSNFYSEVHESYLDRGGFGTASLFVGESRLNGGLFFRNEVVGSFSICENAEGYVDTHVREFKLTIRQAVQEYGEDNHPDLLKAYNADSKNHQKEVDFIQCVYPRMERDAGNPSAIHQPFASVHLDITHNHVVRHGGYKELPHACSRFLKWGRVPYGWSPAVMALPDIRQVNFLAKNLDLLTELKLFPRVLLPSGMKGQVDLRPGGITYMKDGAAADMQPKEWATAGDMRDGMAREAAKKEQINLAFHVDLFRMFAQLDRQMTAREVAERASEKLIQFSPTFARLTTEFYTPILRRLFRLLYDMAKFPPAPPQLFQRNGEQWFLAQPEITYNSRVALAMRQVSNVSFLRTMDALAPMAQIRPEILDHYNWNAIARDMGRNEGTPEGWLLPAAEVAQMQQARAQRMAQMEQSQIAQNMAGSIAKIGAVPAESPVADAVKEGIGQLQGMAA